MTNNFTVNEKQLTARKTRLKDFQRTSRGLVSFLETCNEVEELSVKDIEKAGNFFQYFNFVRKTYLHRLSGKKCTIKEL